MKDPVNSRLNRVEGQIKAVKKMYKEGRSCDEIVQQIQASRSALGKIATALLTDEARLCLEKGDFKGFEEVLDKTFKTA